MQIVTNKQEEVLMVLDSVANDMRVGEVTNRVGFSNDTKSMNLMLRRLVERGLLSREMIEFMHGHVKLEAWAYRRTEEPYKFGKLKRKGSTKRPHVKPRPTDHAAMDQFLNIRRKI